MVRTQSKLISVLAVVLSIPLVGSMPMVQMAHAQQRQPTTWGDIKDFFGQRKQRGGSKGGLCPLAPSSLGMNEPVWSRKPMIVWRGELERVEVQSVDGQDVLWRWDAAEDERAGAVQGPVAYAGELLEPGKSYRVAMYLPGSGGEGAPSLVVMFTVLPESDRLAVEKSLNRLTKHYQKFGFTAEQLARYRAAFFAQRGLWSDAVGEMNVVGGSRVRSVAKIGGCG